MSGELPPAVARFVADAEPFERGASQAEKAANKFGREADKAALSARRMGLAAKEAGEKAAVAQRAAAEAAEKAAKGMLKENEAAKLAARAVRELERAELAASAAAIASAEASEKAAGAYVKQAAGAKTATKSATLMRGELVTLVAAGLALAPAFVAAGAGAVAFGAMAFPTVAKVVKAQTEMAEQWDSLSQRQKVSATSTRALTDQYKELAKSVEPDVLKVYNRALDITAATMPKLIPITKATSRALLDFENRIDGALNSDRATQFFSFVEREAGPAMDALGDALGGSAHMAVALVESLAPLATAGLQVVGMTTNLIGSLADLDPQLAQLAVLALGAKGPISGLTTMVGNAGERYRTFAASAKGAGMATKLLNLATAAGPNLYMAAGLAVAYLGLKMMSAKSATDRLVDSMRVANRAVGNNIDGYKKLATQLTVESTKALQQHNAEYQKVIESGGQLNANTIDRAKAAYAAEQASKQLSAAAEEEAAKARTAIAGADALAQKYGITRAQAVRLADAVGVKLADGIQSGGKLTAEAAAKFDRYRQSVELANDPTRLVAMAWEDLGNAALGPTERINALNAAMQAFFNPAMNVLSATNQMTEALAASNKVLRDGKASALDRSKALEAQLAPIGRYIQAQIESKKTVTLGDQALRRQFGSLVQLSRGSRVGAAALDGLVASMGGTITRAKGATTIIDRYGNRIKVLPSGKVTLIKAETAAAQAKLAATKRQIDGIRSKSVTITTNMITIGSRTIPKAVLAKQKATGGPVAGPGTGTSDDVPIWASNGEYVINARSTAKHRALVEAINADRYADGGMVGMPRFASGGQVRVGGVMVSAAQWRNLGLTLGKDFMKGMTGSTSEIASMDRRLEKAVAKLFGGKSTTLDNKLIKYLDKGADRLQDLSERRALAKEGLAEGKQYAATLTGNAKSFAALSGLDAPTSAAQIRQGLQMKLSQLTRFTSVIKALGKRGLSKSLLKQVLDMGPEQGTQYGEMLLGASKGVFADINAVQKQIDRSAASFGYNGADLLYDAGKKAGAGFLTGLKDELKQLDKSMDALAKKMAKSIKRALKIKSPSQLPELRQAGAMTVAGVAAGMTSGLPVIDLAAERMARRLAQPRLRPSVAALAPRARPTLSPGAAAPRVELRVFLDGREIRASVQQQTLRYNRRNPTNGLSLTRTG